MYGYNAVAVPKNVVIYARVSTEHEAQLSALENQLDWYKPLNSIPNGRLSAVMLTKVSREHQRRNVRSSCRCSVMQRTATSI